jgi:hypothetical protein
MEALVECLQTEYICSHLHSGGGPFSLPVYCGGFAMKIVGGVLTEVHLVYYDIMVATVTASSKLLIVILPVGLVSVTSRLVSPAIDKYGVGMKLMYPMPPPPP